MGITIFNRKVGGMRLELVAEGILTVDGSEQTLVEDVLLSNLSGFVSLALMEVGDTVTIRQYVDLNGDYRLYADETYHDAQIQPAVFITSKTSNTKMKITLQQSAGTYRSFAYEFNREV